MKIALPIAGFHRGNTGEYLCSALLELGHTPEIITGPQFYSDIQSPKFDLYLYVDSGEPLDFLQLPEKLSVPVAMWFIDFRHNKHRPERVPNDWKNALELHQRGGTIFQAQQEDVQVLKDAGLTNVHWIPVAADPNVWSDTPVVFPKIFEIGFVGNVWDQPRAQVLQALIQSPLKVGFKGHGGAWKEDGAALLRQCKAGFNISSFYGSPESFDVNMRFFETLSCGIPLITNFVPSLSIIIPNGLECVKIYHSPEELSKNLMGWLQDEAFLRSGSKGRDFIVEGHTYVHRAQEMLRILWSADL